MLDETLLQYQGNDLVMDLSSLLAYEYWLRNESKLSLENKGIQKRVKRRKP